jgi:L-ascorbate metabolism protein UlaG (beta-lactamase superfamily)
MNSSDTLSVRRLGNAGVEISLGQDSILIDLFRDNSPLEPFVGPVHTELPGPSAGPALAALVTHLHSDHADPGSIADGLVEDGAVLRPRRSGGEGLEVAGLAVAEAGFAELGLEQHELDPWDQEQVGPFSITAVPAVDGFGDPQVSWVVEAGGTRIFHGGDTIFHGWWWPIRDRCGAIDLALLPINGPTVSLPHRQPPYPFPAALDPQQAASAAQILGAKLAVGIHYDTFQHDPTYVQVKNPTQCFAEEAGALGVGSATVDPGALVDLSALVATAESPVGAG